MEIIETYKNFGAMVHILVLVGLLTLLMLCVSLYAFIKRGYVAALLCLALSLPLAFVCFSIIDKGPDTYYKHS